MITRALVAAVARAGVEDQFVTLRCCRDANHAPSGEVVVSWLRKRSLRRYHALTGSYP